VVTEESRVFCVAGN